MRMYFGWVCRLLVVTARSESWRTSAAAFCVRWTVKCPFAIGSMNRFPGATILLVQRLLVPIPLPDRRFLLS